MRERESLCGLQHRNRSIGQWNGIELRDGIYEYMETLSHKEHHKPANFKRKNRVEPPNYNVHKAEHQIET